MKSATALYKVHCIVHVYFNDPVVVVVTEVEFFELVVEGESLRFAGGLALDDVAAVNDHLPLAPIQPTPLDTRIAALVRPVQVSVVGVDHEVSGSVKVSVHENEALLSVTQSHYFDSTGATVQPVHVPCETTSKCAH